MRKQALSGLHHYVVVVQHLFPPKWTCFAGEGGTLKQIARSRASEWRLKVNGLMLVVVVLLVAAGPHAAKCL